MWSTEKALSSLITNVLVNNKFEQFQLFQDELNAKYLHFLDILKDPVKNLYSKYKIQYDHNNKKHTDMIVLFSHLR